MQTLLGTLMRYRYPVKYERDIVTFADGGQAALDWDTGGFVDAPLSWDAGYLGPEFARTFDADTPVLIVFPGLTGGSNSKYLRHFVIQARRNGMRFLYYD
jgi:hypothetical protein